MAVYTTPIADNPYQTFTTVLDEVAYTITLHWNTRDEAWYITLGRQGLQPLFKTKITNGVDILEKYRSYDPCPKGLLFVIDNEKDWGRLQRDSFSNGRFSLYYIDEFDREFLETIRR